MKNVIYFIFIILIFVNCDDESISNRRITQLDIIPNNASVVKNNSTLAQINNLDKLFGDGIEEVTTDEGEAVTVETAVQVNKNYIFLGKLTTLDGSSTTENTIVNLTTGEVIPLENWPTKLNRIFANETHAFYVSGGSICQVELATGYTTIVSPKVNHWKYYWTLNDYKLTQGTWNYDTWIFVDADMNLYAVDYERLASGHNEGIGAKYSYKNGSWIPDEKLNQTFFPDMPYNIANEIPGSLLINKKWLIIDQNTSKLYEIVMNGLTVNIYNYNIENWTQGSLAYSANVSQEMSTTTYLGFNNMIQNSIISDGKIILKFSTSGNSIKFDEITVPSTVPVTSTVTYGSGYIQYWSGGAITNWNYKDGEIFFLNPTDNNIYKWDLSKTEPESDPLESAENLKFLY